MDAASLWAAINAYAAACGGNPDEPVYGDLLCQRAVVKVAEQLAILGGARPSWQPIDTAPKDGTEVLLAVKTRAGVHGKLLVGHWVPGGHCIEDHPPIRAGWYFWNGCLFDLASDPTHWMALPGAPERTVKET